MSLLFCVYFRFEHLQRNSVTHRQPLIVPISLEASIAEEMTILAHLDIFEQNGFKFLINHEAAGGKKLQLTAVPLSQNIIFGEQDVHELASLIDSTIEDGYQSDDNIGTTNLMTKNYLLEGNIPSSSLEGMAPSEGNHVNEEDFSNMDMETARKRRKPTILLPKLVAKYASRACRTAVMIGTGLQIFQMKTIVNHLGTLEQPWNCPHGRPTIRHVMNMKSLLHHDNKNK